MRLQFDYDSGGPGGRGSWVLIALAGIIATVITIALLAR